jgi:hypothetical protein
LYVDKSLGFSRVRTECNFSLVKLLIGAKAQPVSSLAGAREGYVKYLARGTFRAAPGGK